MFQSFSYTHLIVLAICVVLVVAVVWAVVTTLRDTSVRTADKVVWTIVLIVFPAIGLALWLIARIVKRRRTAEAPQEPQI
jgi:Na+/pantothenate symporter